MVQMHNTTVPKKVLNGKFHGRITVRRPRLWWEEEQQDGFHAAAKYKRKEETISGHEYLEANYWRGQSPDAGCRAIEEDGEENSISDRIIYIYILCDSTAKLGFRQLHCWGLYITQVRHARTRTRTHRVGRLRTSDQLVAEAVTETGSRQTYALDRTATGIDISYHILLGSDFGEPE